QHVADRVELDEEDALRVLRHVPARGAFGAVLLVEHAGLRAPEISTSEVDHLAPRGCHPPRPGWDARVTSASDTPPGAEEPRDGPPPVARCRCIRLWRCCGVDAERRERGPADVPCRRQRALQ